MKSGEIAKAIEQFDEGAEKDELFLLFYHKLSVQVFLITCLQEAGKILNLKN